MTESAKSIILYLFKTKRYLLIVDHSFFRFRGPLYEKERLTPCTTEDVIITSRDVIMIGVVFFYFIRFCSNRLRTDQVYSQLDKFS